MFKTEESRHAMMKQYALLRRAHLIHCDLFGVYAGGILQEVSSKVDVGERCRQLVPHDIASAEVVRFVEHPFNGEHRAALVAGAKVAKLDDRGDGRGGDDGGRSERGERVDEF